MEKIDRLIAFIRSHGVTCHAETDGTIRALTVFTLDSVPGSEWETVQPTLQAVRSYLGY